MAGKKPIPFGNYYLLDRINVGGMAEVYRAKMAAQGAEQVVAIKRILPMIAEDTEFISMFLDEAKISVQLTHPNICRVFDLGKNDETYFIAMEYLAGRDVRAIFDFCKKRGEPAPIPLTCHVVAEMCRGLDYAHRRKDLQGKDLNVVHRDVSPQNCLVGFDGEVKVIDFGIAKAANRAQKTQAGILKGKFGYMSPEQVRGQPLDRRSDVFACGVLLHELLTAERLFVGSNDLSVLEKVRQAAVPQPTKRNRRIPASLEKIVLKALARDTSERYQWASELADALTRFLGEVDASFGSRELAQYMRTTFAEDFEREKQRQAEYAELHPPAPPPSQMATVLGAPAYVSTTPPPPRPAARSRPQPVVRAGTPLPATPPAGAEPGGPWYFEMEPPTKQLGVLPAELRRDLDHLDSPTLPPGGPEAVQAVSTPPPRSTSKPPGRTPTASQTPAAPAKPKPAGDSTPRPTASGGGSTPRPAPRTSTGSLPKEVPPPAEARTARARTEESQADLVKTDTAKPKPAADPTPRPAASGGGSPPRPAPRAATGTPPKVAQPPPPPEDEPEESVTGLVKTDAAKPALSAHRSKGRIRPLTILAAALAVLLSGGVTAVALLRYTEGTLVLKYQPMDAVVLLDGERICDSSPCVKRGLKAGPHRLELRKEGLEPFADVVEVPRGGRFERTDLTLVPSSSVVPATIASDPADAEIKIDGRVVKAAGKPGVWSGELPAGVAHQVEVSKPGFETWMKQVTPAAGERQVSEFAGPLKRLSLSVRFTTHPAGAKVLADGKDLGVTPLTVETLDPLRGHKVLFLKACHDDATYAIPPGGGTLTIDKQLTKRPGCP